MLEMFCECKECMVNDLHILFTAGHLISAAGLK